MPTPVAEAPDADVSPVAQHPNAEAKSSGWSWASIVAALFSGASVTLLLLGYGVAASVEERLGVARSSLYAGAIDLLELSTIAVLMITDLLSRSFGGLLALLYRENWPQILAMLGLWFIVYWVPWQSVGQRFGRLRDGSGRAASARRWLAKNALKGHQLWLALVIAASPVFGTMLIPLILMVLFVPMLAVYMGMSAGNLYLTRYVFEPKACVSLPLHTWPAGAATAEKPADPKREKVAGATCLVIEDQQGREIARGRLAVGTTKALVIVLKDGVAKRFDSAGLTQYAVREL